MSAPDPAVIIQEPVLFEWDDGNREKNLERHGITMEEAEQAFLDPEKKILHDPIHSSNEKRNLLLGKTQDSRILVIAFALRDTSVRVISARRAGKKEQLIYHS